MEIDRSGEGQYFSDYVIFNNVVTIRGITANDQSKGIEDQTADCLKQIDEYLTIAGSHKERILTSTVYISDMANKSGMNAAWLEWLATEHKPTRATVQTPLATSNTLVEIVVSAAL